MNLSDLYTEVIAEYNASTKDKRELQHPDMVLAGVNPSCGDEIEIAVKVRDGRIEDAAFTGTGCAISQASAAMMVELMQGKTLAEAAKLITIFLGMIKREITDETLLAALEEAVALKNIANLPARVKCAVLPWRTLEKAMKEYGAH